MPPQSNKNNNQKKKQDQSSRSKIKGYYTTSSSTFHGFQGDSVGRFNSVFPAEADKLDESDLQDENVNQYQQLDSKKEGDDVPFDPQDFYNEFGHEIIHPLTGKPVDVLAPYQYSAWKALQNHKQVIVVKSQKIGLTTIYLLADFQFAILPSRYPQSCRGKEILVVAQDLTTARNHITTLKHLIMSSEKYKKYLITSPVEGLNKDEVSKVERLYIYNPDRPREPTVIVARGGSKAALWSWKKVKHIHMSDVAVIEGDYADTINSAMTRLANTEGTFLIETPPAGPRGKVYEVWNQAQEYLNKKALGEIPQDEDKEFYPMQIQYREAVKAGVISEEKIESFKKIFGPTFPQYFEAAFISHGGNVYSFADIERAVELGRRINYKVVNPYSHKCMGVDPGSGSSKFGICIAQMTDHIEIIYAKEFERRGIVSMIEFCIELSKYYYCSKFAIDAANAGVITTFKQLVGENHDTWNLEMDYYRRRNIDLFKAWRVVPKAFNHEGRPMLYNSQMLIEKGKVAIHPDFVPLLNQMKSATMINGELDKTKNPLDLIDAFRLCLSYFQLPKSKEQIEAEEMMFR